nr:MAG TPA: hypothetical protein [Caudoviricetes sp.]
MYNLYHNYIKTSNNIITMRLNAITHITHIMNIL